MLRFRDSCGSRGQAKRLSLKKRFRAERVWHLRSNFGRHCALLSMFVAL